jgi:hypothetical protein
MSSLKHMINSMVAGMKMDTDNQFDVIDQDLRELDRKLAETEALFVQGIEAVRFHRGRINRALGRPDPNAGRAVIGPQDRESMREAQQQHVERIPRVATQGPRKEQA